MSALPRPACAPDPPPPRPLAELGYAAYAALPYLRRFALVGELMRAGVGSHRRAAAEILRRKKAGLLPKDTPHSTYSISVLPVLLDDLFRRAFGRPVELWRGPEGRAYHTLSADGEVGLDLALAYLAGVDRSESANGIADF